MHSNYPGKHASFDFKEGVRLGKDRNALLFASFVLRHADRLLFIKGIHVRLFILGNMPALILKRGVKLWQGYKGNFHQQKFNTFFSILRSSIGCNRAVRPHSNNKVAQKGPLYHNFTAISWFEIAVRKYLIKCKEIR